MQVELLIKELEETLQTRFSDGGYLYDIFWSECNDGWMINVYDESYGELVDEDGELIDDAISDGGLCTGTAKDAIFMFLGE